MGSTGDRSPDPTPACGSACLAQSTSPPWHLTSAVVFSERHPRPHAFATHPAVGGDGYARPEPGRQRSPQPRGCPLSRTRKSVYPGHEMGGPNRQGFTGNAVTGISQKVQRGFIQTRGVCHCSFIQTV